MTDTPDAAGIVEDLRRTREWITRLPDEYVGPTPPECVVYAATCRQAAAVIRDLQDQVVVQKAFVHQLAQSVEMYKAALANPTAGGGEGEA